MRAPADELQTADLLCPKAYNTASADCVRLSARMCMSKSQEEKEKEKKRCWVEKTSLLIQVFFKKKKGSFGRYEVVDESALAGWDECLMICFRL